MTIQHYKLESFIDRDCKKRGDRLSLSARSDPQAIEQMRAVCGRHESAGESRMLVLSHSEGTGWVEVARMGTRRYARCQG